jgi:hypothetical protein
MKTSTNSFVFIFLALLVVACHNNQREPNPISLQPVKNLSQFNDTTFFTGTSAMLFAGNHVYIADDINKIYQLGLQLNLTGSMGKSGKGPGEFTGVSAMSFINDSLFVYDRTQAKVLVYDDKNHFVREIGVPDASGFSMAVDGHSHIFLSVIDRQHPIVEFNAHGQKINVFGGNTVKPTSRHSLRNLRLLFIDNDKLMAISKSECFIKVYNLYGTLLSRTTIAPPQIWNIIAQVKKENEAPHFLGLAMVYNDAVIYKNNLYLLKPPMHKKNTTPWPHKFTYVFKYKLKPNGGVTFVRTFKLFRHNQHKLLYGYRLAAVGNHKLLVVDMESGKLLEFKDKNL